MIRLKRLYIVILAATLFVHASREEKTIEYHEVAAIVMINALEAKPKKSFLKKLYSQLLFVPVWMKEEVPSSASNALFTHVKNDPTLDKDDRLYKELLHLEEQQHKLYAEHSTLKQKIDLEFKISRFYKEYTDYAYFGSINWGAFQARISNLIVNDVSTEWILHRPKANAIGILEKVLFGADLADELEKAIPQKYHFRQLQQKVAEYREIKANGGWERVSLDKTLKSGESAEGVPSLRQRLSVTKDYLPCDESSETLVYDECLQKAVKHFQQRNGLAVDGEVGPRTLAVLNKSVDERIQTLLLNLDRIKWLNNPNSKRHIIINIPDFMLYFEQDGELIQTFRTIVGTPKNPTPIFSNSVKTIVLNPQWNVPKSIIQKEYIPELLRDPNVLRKDRIEVYDGWGRDAVKVNPSSVNWAKYRYSKTVPYRLAQTAGTHNALGKIKFLFPNKFSVYMHDTPTKYLFAKDKRAFSHGCIRLQKPRELLETFSTFEKNVDLNKSYEILEGTKKKYLSLDDHVPIDVIYLTAWVDYEGQLQFRNDVYRYDEMQLKSFKKW
jgi:L,D-transpeptidase YcbB